MSFLSESLRLSPGVPVPHGVRSTRLNWAGILGAGKPAADLPSSLRQVYNLCGYAHYQCASAAVRAAQGDGDEQISVHQRRQLQWGSVREHVRRMWLDWPLQLADLPGHRYSTAEAEAALRSCPAWVPEPNSANMLAWLQSHVVGEGEGDSRQAWLARWQDNPALCLQRWSEGRTTPLASLMHAIVQRNVREVAPDPDLMLTDATGPNGQVVASLLADMGANPRFCLTPLVMGQCASTGVWSRANDPQRAALVTPALRMAARVAELLRLCLPDDPLRGGAAWLSTGSKALGGGAGLAWTEMGRGLLIHHVRLMPDGLTVGDCQVIAPTEWNFHPRGAMARTMAAMPTQLDSQAQLDIALLVASYDPCVPFQLQLEAAHA